MKLHFLDAMVVDSPLMVGNEVGLHSRLKQRNLQKKGEKQFNVNDQPECKVIKKDHTGNVDLVNWDKEAMKAEVEGYDDQHLISWRDLATRYNVCNSKGQLASNSGQLVK
jgi:hypothetical protein